jgi:adenylate cyclase
VPVELLTLIREAAGSSPPLPDDPVRDGAAVCGGDRGPGAAGFDPIAAQRLLRVHGDSLRRMAETEVAWFQSEVLMPALAAGKRPDEIFGLELAHRLTVLMESAVVELYRLIQKGAWTAVIIEGLEMQLAAAGLHSRLEHPPAMCFLDITGSTGLAQERGRPVKWLGDGVMLHCKDPGPGVVAALEMVAGGAEAGLPPLHVGLHAGPMIFQEGDYYGQTVNVASRIADYARPGEVLVSQEVVDASSGADVIFREIGPVELKGVAGAMRLHAASGPP